MAHPRTLELFRISKEWSVSCDLILLRTAYLWLLVELVWFLKYNFYHQANIVPFLNNSLRLVQQDEKPTPRVSTQ